MIPIRSKDIAGEEIINQTPTVFASEHFGVVEECATRLLYIYSKNGQKITHVGTLERGKGIIQRLEENQSFLNSLKEGVVDKAVVDAAALETYDEIKKKYNKRFGRR